MSQITLIRHCAIETKFHGHYNGHIDIELSHEGKQQAIILSKNINKLAKTYSIDSIYCSDLRRCKQSIAPFMEQNPQIAVQYSKKLREKFWGRHEGMSFAQICQKENIHYQNFQQWLEYLDGESLTDFHHRTIDYFENLNKIHQGQHIIVMTHAGNIRTLLAHALKLNLEQAFSLKIPYGFHLQLENLMPIEEISKFN